MIYSYNKNNITIKIKKYNPIYIIAIIPFIQYN